MMKPRRIRVGAFFMIERVPPTAREPPPVVESAVVVISCGHNQEPAEGA
jgi:16S rRNA A1518/A1519 N6-dimethyltransferase RsmA/KsgA/DIM1 with predicted DNA glycosylase/AP lyase activity